MHCTFEVSWIYRNKISAGCFSVHALDCRSVVCVGWIESGAGLICSVEYRSAHVLPSGRTWHLADCQTIHHSPAGYLMITFCYLLQGGFVFSAHCIYRTNRRTIAMTFVCLSVCLSVRPFSLSPPLDNIRVMMIVWRLRGNIIRTALCWIVWHNVHSQQHTYMSSSYRSNRLGLSHWDPYAVRRGGCLELYYCNMVEWFLCDSSLIFDDQLVSFSALILLVWSSGL